ncbi:hypothetical protein NLA06_01965 [Desulfomicrobium sp. ZS1]|uniref:hypothetical protein n=1 Tax=Desulfomicrobium sp. ZS1 TaxID=2952228 RepID=UPI0020B4255C|nr:hypothetical protein [Desulfomicrobium sp. ZS1]UTF50676.1 hypothetical protein NLA06_01965 [Desulfomicrobium sp. ZS1]
MSATWTQYSGAPSQVMSEARSTDNPVRIDAHISTGDPFPRAVITASTVPAGSAWET